ncbi:MAG: HAMP domain-containing sensor histidine kinase [Planctomycetota bacterium]
MSDTPESASTPSDGRLSITDRELFDRLRWFTQVRWVFGLFCLLLLLVSWYGLDIRFRVGERLTVAPAVHVVFFLFLYNAVFSLVVRVIRARRRITRRLTESIGLLQLVCDLIAISLLIHRTGGVENFFAILILVPVVIVTELLPQRVAYATAGVAALMLNVVAWGEQQGILPHVRVELAGRGAAAGADRFADPLYVLHVTAALTVTIFALVFVASTIAARLRQREAELEDAYHQLGAADRTKSFFMRKAGHEMRAPLGAIHSILDALAHISDDLGPRRSSLIDRAKQRCQGMMELVNDLLRYSRLRAAEEVFRPEPVDLGAVAAGTVELMKQRARAAGLDLTCTCQPLSVPGNEELLRELVTNLVANAIQYTPSGGRIDVTLERRDHQARLAVADTGIGISKKAAGKIFDEFYRAQNAKEWFREGTGLGLAICKRIVDLHDGSIDARPNGDCGTVFTVQLPLPSPKESPASSPSGQPPGRSGG